MRTAWLLLIGILLLTGCQEQQEGDRGFAPAASDAAASGGSAGDADAATGSSAQDSHPTPATAGTEVATVPIAELPDVQAVDQRMQQEMARLRQLIQNGAAGPQEIVGSLTTIGQIADRAKVLDPELAFHIRRFLAQFHGRMGDFGSAHAELDKAVAVMAGDEQEAFFRHHAAIQSVDLLATEGRDDEALTKAESLLPQSTVEQRSQLYATMAALLLRADRLEAAESLLARVEADPELIQVARLIRTKVASMRIQPGKPVPDFVVTDLEGTERSLASYRGQVLLIDFWASWCMPCIREMPTIERAYAEHGDQGFAVLGISLDRERAAFQEYMAQAQLPWPQASEFAGGGHPLADLFGVESIPATFLVGPDGILIDRDLRGDELVAAVAEAVAALPPPTADAAD